MIPNKQILSHGSVVTNETLNTLQSNFVEWIKAHHHTTKPLSILLITDEEVLDSYIADDNFLLNYTDVIANTENTISDYEPDYLLLNLSNLSEIYNKSILYGKENYRLKNILFAYNDSYYLDENGDHILVFKSPTLTKDEDLNLYITAPKIGTDGGFVYDSTQYYQFSQLIKISKNLINDFEYNSVTKVLTISVDVNEESFIGIPSLPVSAYSISGSYDGNKVTAAEHVSDTSKHIALFTSQSKPIGEAYQFTFATPNWTENHPLYTDGKFMISSNDMTLSLNIIKDDRLSNSVTGKRIDDNPLDSIFRGTSDGVAWMNASTWGGETRHDVAALSGVVEQDYNYDIDYSGGALKYYTVNEYRPRKATSANAATVFNRNIGESVAVKVNKDTSVSAIQADVLKRLPMVVRLSPNVHTKSYMYTYFHNKKMKNSAIPYIGDFKGQTLYNYHRTKFEYGINFNTFYEKVVILGSPYETMCKGAEHIYRITTKKDFNHPDADFNGYYIDIVDLVDIKKEEARWI